MKKKQSILFSINCLFNMKYVSDYEKACLSLDFVEEQFILKLPVSRNHIKQYSKYMNKKKVFLM
jgi:hypothetical protein